MTQKISIILHISQIIALWKKFLWHKINLKSSIYIGKQYCENKGGIKMGKILAMCCMLISIILMATPFGIAMTFASGPHERVTSYYSYFNMLPLGYGNWLPIITAILSIIVLMLLLVSIKSGKGEKPAMACTIICVIASILSWLIFNSFTIIGAAIAVFHGAAILFQMQNKQ